MFLRADLFSMNLPFVFGFIVMVSPITKADLELHLHSARVRVIGVHAHSHLCFIYFFPFPRFGDVPCALEGPKQPVFGFTDSFFSVCLSQFSVCLLNFQHRGSIWLPFVSLVSYSGPIVVHTLLRSSFSGYSAFSFNSSSSFQTIAEALYLVSLISGLHQA